MTADTEQVERWLPVVGWEGLYEVSDWGNVRSLDRTVVVSNAEKRRLRGRMVAQGWKAAYRRVTLNRNGSKSNKLVHRLVLEAFVGPCPPGREACHGPAGPNSNNLTNLSWDTHVKNCADKVRDGTVQRGDKNPYVKFPESVVLAIRADTRLSRVVAAAYGVSQTQVRRIKTGESWGWLKSPTAGQQP